MSTETHIRFSPSKSRSNVDDDGDDARKFLKESRVCYRRDFLLSLADLDVCKRLPSDFDSSISCELNITSPALLKSNSDPGVGVLYGKPNQMNSESGLLGKGSILRTPGSLFGSLTPQVQGGGYYLLKRSASPYRPPHFSKINLQSQMQKKDVYNDKTFGSIDPSGEQVEEERKRRDYFDLMRKSQKAIQGKKKLVPDMQKENLNPGIMTGWEDSPNDKLLEKCSQDLLKCENIEQSIQSDVEHSQPEHHYLESSDIEEKQLNSANHPVASQFHPNFLQKSTWIAMPDVKLGSTRNLENNLVNATDKTADAFDELCLPDEDSLITVDDFIIPDNLVSMTNGNRTSAEVDMLTSTSLAAPTASFGDKRFQPSLEGSSLPFGKSLFREQGQSYPPANVLFHLLETQNAFRNSEVLSPNSKISYFHHGLPKIVHSDALGNPYAQPTSFNDPFIHPSLQQMYVPGEFPVTYRADGWSLGTSTHPPMKAAFHSPDLNHMQDPFLNFSQPFSRGFGMGIPDYNSGGSNGQAVLRKRLYDKGEMLNLMHSGWPLPGNC